MKVSFEELLESLPAEFRTPEVLNGKSDPPYYYRSVKEHYDREMETMIRYAEQCTEPEINFYGFQSDGNGGYGAYFVLNDLAFQHDSNKVNWHLQNMSQVRYNGALSVTKDHVTANH